MGSLHHLGAILSTDAVFWSLHIGILLVHFVLLSQSTTDYIICKEQKNFWKIYIFLFDRQSCKDRRYRERERSSTFWFTAQMVAVPELGWSGAGSFFCISDVESEAQAAGSFSAPSQTISRLVNWKWSRLDSTHMGGFAHCVCHGYALNNRIVLNLCFWRLWRPGLRERLGGDQAS